MFHQLSTPRSFSPLGRTHVHTPALQQTPGSGTTDHSCGDSRSNPGASRPDPIAVLPPIFVDGIAKVFSLPATQAVVLRGFVSVGSVSPALSTPDLATRAYILAAVLSLSEQCKRGFAGAQTDGSVQDLPGLFTDLKIRLEDTFTITKIQKDNIRAIAGDVVYEPNRIQYKTFHIDVKRRLFQDQHILQLNNIFGNPHREKVLVAHLKRITSSVRNGFRQEIRDSINDPKKKSLIEFTYQMTARYKRGGVGDKIPAGYTIHNAILRKFALDNPQLLNIEESVTDEMDADVEITVGASPPPKKMRKSNTGGGRVPDGECFWGRFEQHMSPYVQSWGPDLVAPMWKQFTEDIVRRDQENFPHHTDNSPSQEISQTQVRSTVPQVASSSTSNPEGAVSSGGFNGYDLANLLNPISYS